MTNKRIKVEPAVTSRGYTQWIHPKMRGYLMACCDCGLVHEMQFKAFAITKTMKGGSFVYRELPQDAVRVKFRARRAEKATKLQRKGL